ncbi:hypothetical protein AX14_007623 [Amanita brunnescens Koide BX004]|nr:hypothetical protein AX14_007623 [Amanita brunnescens Koide BX004]
MELHTKQLPGKNSASSRDHHHQVQSTADARQTSEAKKRVERSAKRGTQSASWLLNQVSEGVHDLRPPLRSLFPVLPRFRGTPPRKTAPLKLLSYGPLMSSSTIVSTEGQARVKHASTNAPYEAISSGQSLIHGSPLTGRAGPPSWKQPYPTSNQHRINNSAIKPRSPPSPWTIGYHSTGLI